MPFQVAASIPLDLTLTSFVILLLASPRTEQADISRDSLTASSSYLSGHPMRTPPTGPAESPQPSIEPADVPGPARSSSRTPRPIEPQSGVLTGLNRLPSRTFRQADHAEVGMQVKVDPGSIEWLKAPGLYEKKLVYTEAIDTFIANGLAGLTTSRKQSTDPRVRTATNSYFDLLDGSKHDVVAKLETGEAQDKLMEVYLRITTRDNIIEQMAFRRTDVEASQNPVMEEGDSIEEDVAMSSAATTPPVAQAHNPPDLTEPSLPGGVSVQGAFPSQASSPSGPVRTVKSTDSRSKPYPPLSQATALEPQVPGGSHGIKAKEVIQKIQATTRYTQAYRNRLEITLNTFHVWLREREPGREMTFVDYSKLAVERRQELAGEWVNEQLVDHQVALRGELKASLTLGGLVKSDASAGPTATVSTSALQGAPASAPKIIRSIEDVTNCQDPAVRKRYAFDLKTFGGWLDTNHRIDFETFTGPEMSIQRRKTLLDEYGKNHLSSRVRAPLRNAGVEID